MEELHTHQKIYIRQGLILEVELARMQLGNVQIPYDASGRGPRRGFAQTVRLPSYGERGYGQFVIQLFF